jgi:signal peptidase I
MKKELKKEIFSDTQNIVNELEQESVLSKIGSFFLEAIKVAVFAGITIGIVRYFLFKPFYVKGASMEPNYYDKEYLIVDEITYRFREPERGEVIVFKSPTSEKEYFLKRIIGLPSERVKVEDNKIIIYNEEHPQGIIIDEKYLTENTPGNIGISLGSDEYFVLGDNRDSSMDSRRFGSIKKSDIVGKTWLRGWPLTRISTFQSPEYNL